LVQGQLFLLDFNQGVAGLAFHAEIVVIVKVLHVGRSPIDGFSFLAFADANLDAVALGHQLLPDFPGNPVLAGA